MNDLSAQRYVGRMNDWRRERHGATPSAGKHDSFTYFLALPYGITMGPDEGVWLTDDGNHTIRKFTPDGKLLLSIGDPDQPAPAQSGRPFNRPTHVGICPRTGAIYISDGYGNSRVHKHESGAERSHH